MVGVPTPDLPAAASAAELLVNEDVGGGAMRTARMGVAAFQAQVSGRPGMWAFAAATADADPGSGLFRLNHATPASATAAYVDSLAFGGVDVSAWLDTLDDGGDASNRGMLMIYSPAAPATMFRIYTVSGSVVDGTGYRKLTLAHVAGAGSFTAGTLYALAFSSRGPGADDKVAKAGDTMTGALTISPGTALDDSDWLMLTPTDFGAGKPYLLVKKTDVADRWNIGLWDGSSIDGAINFAVQNLTHNDKPVLTGGTHVVGYWPARALVRPTTSPAAALAQAESTTNDVNDEYIAFANGSILYVGFSFRAPESLDESASLSVEIEWTEAAGATSHVCRWRAQAQAQGDGDTIDGAWGGSSILEDTGSSGTRRFVTLASVVPAGSWAAGDKIHIRVSREGDHANDTLDVAAHLIGVTVKATVAAGTD